MTPKMFATVSGIIFLLVALAHLLRVFGGFGFEVGGWNLPSWGSIVAAVVAGYLSYTGLRIATRH
jgi:uncharacterized membrane protein